MKRSDEWINRMRAIKILVDGQQISEVYNGETRTISLPDGTHTLKARIDWCGSRERTFTISGDGQASYFISSFGYPYRFFTISLVAIAAYLLCQVAFGISMWPLLLPFAGLLCYYCTFGRNDYLLLREEGVEHPDLARRHADAGRLQ